jgi:hypothetical protein
MPQSQQVPLLQGYNDFKDALLAFLDEKAGINNASGAGSSGSGASAEGQGQGPPVITKAEVDAFIGSFRRAQAEKRERELQGIF